MVFLSRVTSSRAVLVDDPVPTGTEVRVLAEHGKGTNHRYADIEVDNRRYQVTADWLAQHTQRHD